MKKHFEITIKGNEKVILSAVQWFKGTHFICLFFIYLQSVLIYLFFFVYCPSFSCQLLHWLSKFFMFFCFDFVLFFYLFVLNISLSNLLSVLMKTHQNKFIIFFFFCLLSVSFEANVPYAALGGQEIVEALRRGERLSRPERCTDEMYVK